MRANALESYAKIFDLDILLPPEKKLANELLIEVYDEVIEKTVENMIPVETVCLTQDGWSSVQNDPIIVHAFSDEKKHIY